MSSSFNPTDTNDIPRWLKECRRRNSRSMTSTYSGQWLSLACKVIERQHEQRQVLIASISGAVNDEEAMRILHALDSIQGGRHSLLAMESAAVIRRMLRDREDASL